MLTGLAAADDGTNCMPHPTRQAVGGGSLYEGGGRGRFEFL